MADTAPLSSGQRRTAAARRALAERFPDAESKSEHYRDLGRKAAAERIVLSGEDADALRAAYALLDRIARRGKIATPADVRHTVGQPEDAGRDEPSGQ
jgi:hypothetical protein